jgi:hypothetical protein
MTIDKLILLADRVWVLAPVALGLLGALWHAIPQPTRDAIERRVPRLVGVLRLAYALGPDLSTAWATIRTQLVAGQPRRPAPDAPPPERPTMAPPTALLLVLLLGAALAAGCAGVAGVSWIGRVYESVEYGKCFVAGATVADGDVKITNHTCAWVRGPRDIVPTDAAAATADAAAPDAPPDDADAPAGPQDAGAGDAGAP